MSGRTRCTPYWRVVEPVGLGERREDAVLEVFGTPTPVSRTSKRITSLSAMVSTTVTRIAHFPFAVNLIAFAEEVAKT